MPDATALLWILAAYALGSVSFAYLLVRLVRGYDLRTIGSGNLGATNAGRAIGARGAFAIYLLDFGKGFAPVMWARFGLGDPTLFGVLPLSIAMGSAAFIGHCWPVYLQFRGGKGVATASGAVLALAPAAGGVTFIAFILTVAAFRMVSLGSLVAAIVLPVAFIAIERRAATEQPGLAIMTFFLVLTALVIVRHRANIQRIVDGTEQKIGRPKPTSTSPADERKSP